jgi:SAM-dependent methyltransferase
MPSIYRVMKSAWQKLPASVRSNRMLLGLAAKVSRRTIAGAGHEEIYDANYYRFIDAEALTASNAMAQTIVQHFKPGTLVDVGCGTGAFLAAVRDRSVQTFGLEYSAAGLEYCAKRNLNVHRFDLASASPPPVPRCDVCTSFEVAEHLPPELADRFMETLVVLAGTVILTAATPGQGGAGHINEQPHQYWIDKAKAHGLVFEESLSNHWREEWRSANLPFWYANNVMIFQAKR